MKKILFGFLSFLSSPTILWAKSSAGESSGFPDEVLWQGIGFILLLVALVKFLKKPIKNALEKRSSEIKASFDQLTQREKELEVQIGIWERKLNSLPQEIAELHQKIIAQGEAERQHIIARAQEEKEHIKKQAQTVAEQEFKKALLALKKETIELAVAMAQDLLPKALQPKDQERLVKEFIGQIGAIP